MSGLPRSGSTLLTALLNQNPEIHASTNSPLLDTIHYTEEYLLKDSEQYKAHPNPEGAHKVLSSIPENYYCNTPQNIIVDKSRGWANQIECIQDYITKEPKIICPVRDGASRTNRTAAHISSRVIARPNGVRATCPAMPLSALKR